MVDFVPPKSPSAPRLSIAKKAAVRRAEFEGGYSQRSGAGPNPVSSGVKLTFTRLQPFERDEIDAFLTARAGKESFRYQVPGMPDPLLWTCAEWEVKPERSKVLWTVTASFQQEFDIS